MLHDILFDLRHGEKIAPGGQLVGTELCKIQHICACIDTEVCKIYANGALKYNTSALALAWGLCKTRIGHATGKEEHYAAVWVWVCVWVGEGERGGRRSRVGTWACTPLV